jgi:uncharacterized protein (TIGR03083 family)
MTNAAIDALHADREALLQICAGLSDADWKADSGCPGWSVQDLVTHLGTLYWMVVDPSTLPDAGGQPTEVAQEIHVDARRAWSAEQVVEDYRSVSTAAVRLLAELQAQDFEVPLGDLGTYHVSLLPSAFVFDHYTHIRADLFPPRGPLAGPAPGAGEAQLGVAVDWIDAALPQQNRAVLQQLDGSGAVMLDVTGSKGRTIEVGSGPVVATVTGPAPALIRWVTQRGSWDELGVVAAGDETALAAVRGLHVF